MENFIFSAVRVHIDKYISLKMKKEKHASSIFMKNKTKKTRCMKIFITVYIILSKESDIPKASENVSVNYIFISKTCSKNCNHSSKSKFSSDTLVQ